MEDNGVNNNLNENSTEDAVVEEQIPAVSQDPSSEMELPFLKNLAGWATFKAIIDIITGALSCFGIITAAYGIPQIISGIKLLNATDGLKSYMSTGDTTKMGDVLYNFNKYFKLSGISIIIKIVFIVIFLVVYGIIIAYIFSNAGDFFNNLPGDFRID